MPAWKGPAAVSPALVHLLGGCLRVRASERWSMREVRDHAWFLNPKWDPCTVEEQESSPAAVAAASGGSSISEGLPSILTSGSANSTAGDGHASQPHPEAPDAWHSTGNRGTPASSAHPPLHSSSPTAAAGLSPSRRLSRLAGERPTSQARGLQARVDAVTSVSGQGSPLFTRHGSRQSFASSTSLSGSETAWHATASLSGQLGQPASPSAFPPDESPSPAGSQGKRRESPHLPPTGLHARRGRGGSADSQAGLRLSAARK